MSKSYDSAKACVIRIETKIHSFEMVCEKSPNAQPKYLSMSCFIILPYAGRDSLALLLNQPFQPASSLKITDLQHLHVIIGSYQVTPTSKPLDTEPHTRHPTSPEHHFSPPLILFSRHIAHAFCPQTRLPEYCTVHQEGTPLSRRRHEIYHIKR